MGLIGRCQAGDEAAFAALFEKYKNLVYKTAFLMLDSTEEAEDALQEVFLRVHQALNTYQPGKAAFTTWLHRLTVNHCLNRRRKRYVMTLPLTEAADLTDPSSPIADHLTNEALVRQALTHLPDKQRAVVILRYYWDLSYLDIAQILEIPLGTVRSRLNTAMKSLHRVLTALEKEPPATLPLALNQGGIE